MPAVALCLPTLDRGPLFERTLKSLLAQTFTDFELVVTDNASTTEQAKEAVERANDPRVRYVRHPVRIGMGANWNSAIALTTAPLVAVFHDDDSYRPQMVGRMVARLQADPTLAFVHTATEHRDEEGRSLGLLDFGWPARVTGSDFRLRFARNPGRSPVEAQSVVMRRAAFEAAGPFRDDWVQATDLDEWLRLSRHGGVGYVDEPLVDVRLRTAPRAPTVRDVQALSEKLTLARLVRAELGSPAERARSAVRWERYFLSELASLALRGDDGVRSAALELARGAGLPSRLLGRLLLGEGRSEWPRRGLRAVSSLRKRARGAVR